MYADSANCDLHAVEFEPQHVLTKFTFAALPYQHDQTTCVLKHVQLLTWDTQLVWTTIRLLTYLARAGECMTQAVWGGMPGAVLFSPRAAQVLAKPKLTGT